MNILLVEDEELLCRSLTQLLQRAGFTVVAATNATDAMTAVATFVPDILITDWLLQGDIDGIALARRLRQTAPELRVIVITGLLAATARSEIQRAGIVSVILEKPFPFADLQAAITRITQ